MGTKSDPSPSSEVIGLNCFFLALNPCGDQSHQGAKSCHWFLFVGLSCCKSFACVLLRKMVILFMIRAWEQLKTSFLKIQKYCVTLLIACGNQCMTGPSLRANKTNWRGCWKLKSTKKVLVVCLFLFGKCLNWVGITKNGEINWGHWNRIWIPKI